MQKIAVLTMVILALTVYLACTSNNATEMTLAPISLPPTRTPILTVPGDTPIPSPTLSLRPSPTPQEIPATPPATAIFMQSTPTSAPLPVAVETEVPVAVIPMAELSSAMLGQEVSVEGRVIAAESFSAGFKFLLDDSTGQIVLLMWRAIYLDCWDGPGLNLGARVQASGVLDEYGGELQIQPAWGSDVRAVVPADAWAEPRQIGSLSGSDEGLRVMIEGRVIRTAGGDAWAKVFVEDESGEIGVFIWRNVLDLIPNNTGLGTEGSRVRVVGTVTIYQSNLELVPALPYDVTVLEIP